MMMGLFDKFKRVGGSMEEIMIREYFNRNSPYPASGILFRIRAISVVLGCPTSNRTPTFEPISS